MATDLDHAAVPTWCQYRAHAIRVAAEQNGATLAEAECVGDNYLPEWRALAEAAIVAGWVPPQCWINAALTREADGRTRRYGWWESFLHHRPDVMDRLYHAGRSSHMTLCERERGV